MTNKFKVMLLMNLSGLLNNNLDEDIIICVRENVRRLNCCDSSVPVRLGQGIAVQARADRATARGRGRCSLGLRGPTC